MRPGLGQVVAIYELIRHYRPDILYVYNGIVESDQWAKAHFFIAVDQWNPMSVIAKEEIVAKIAEIAERVGDPEGIEIVDVQLLGAGRGRLLRIFIDRPASRPASRGPSARRLARRLRIYFAPGRNYFGYRGRHTWGQLHAGGQFAGLGA